MLCSHPYSHSFDLQVDMSQIAVQDKTPTMKQKPSKLDSDKTPTMKQKASKPDSKSTSKHSSRKHTGVTASLIHLMQFFCSQHFYVV